MAMRGALLGLIGERNRLGGEERLLNVDERLKLDVRAASRKPSNGAPAFSRESLSRTCAGVGTGSRQENASNKNSAPRSDAIGTEKARGRRER